MAAAEPATPELVASRTYRVGGRTEPGTTVRVEVNGQSGGELKADAEAVVPQSGLYESRIPGLTVGPNALTLRLADALGNVGDTVLRVTVTEPRPKPAPRPLAGAQPVDQALLATPEARVSGTGEPGAAVVVAVNGEVGAQAHVDADGKDEVAAVALTEGVNALVVRCDPGVGAVQQQTRQVVVDLTPPPVEAEAPAPGGDVAAPTVDVTVRSEPGAKIVVQVNGVAQAEAVVGPTGQTTFPAVPLVMGENRLTATGTDEVGNQARALWRVWRRR